MLTTDVRERLCLWPRSPSVRGIVVAAVAAAADSARKSAAEPRCAVERSATSDRARRGGGRCSKPTIRELTLTSSSANPTGYMPARPRDWCGGASARRSSEDIRNSATESNGLTRQAFRRSQLLVCVRGDRCRGPGVVQFKAANTLDTSCRWRRRNFDEFTVANGTAAEPTLAAASFPTCGPPPGLLSVLSLLFTIGAPSPSRTPPPSILSFEWRPGGKASWGAFSATHHQPSTYPHHSRDVVRLPYAVDLDAHQLAVSTMPRCANDVRSRIDNRSARGVGCGAAAVKDQDPGRSVRGFADATCQGSRARCACRGRSVLFARDASAPVENLDGLMVLFCWWLLPSLLPRGPPNLLRLPVLHRVAFFWRSFSSTTTS